MRFLRHNKPEVEAKPAPRAKAGFSLIEILVALLVLSIGLVGLAALHINSLKSAHSSYYRSLASTIALNLEERIWNEVSLSMIESGDLCPGDSDENGSSGGEGDGEGGGEELSGGLLGGIRQALQDDWGNSTGPTTSGFDWNASNYAMLPGLKVTFGDIRTGCVTRPSSDLDGQWLDRWIEIPLTLEWDEARFDEAGQLEKFHYVTRMNCIPEWAPGETSESCS